MSEQTPVTEDANATVAELRARAAADFTAVQAAAQAKADAEGTEVREGVLPGGGC
ncbi:hypothetical protein [Streptomyces sp. NPDC005549]|uniref:hypothetical protein n=1 Tax=Streptomyces sp. NPDC005549 TaxID=3154888 RepID=UPI00339E8CF3